MKSIKQLYGSILSSKVKEQILTVLHRNPPLRQTEIVKKAKQKQQNVSVILNKLEKEGLAECLTPDKKAWKVYAITDLGKEVIEYLKKEKENIKKRLK